MKVDINKTSGKSSGKKITLSDKIFGIEPNDHAIYLDVKSYLKNQRQGNSKVKGRSEIVGSTRKIKKQKGTGTARAGSIKSSREVVKFLDLNQENIITRSTKKLKI